MKKRVTAIHKIISFFLSLIMLANCFDLIIGLGTDVSAAAEDGFDTGAVEASLVGGGYYVEGVNGPCYQWDAAGFPSGHRLCNLL